MARAFKPISQGEMKQLLDETQMPGSDGKLEPWKTTDYGSRHHRAQHGDECTVYRITAFEVGE